MVVEIVALLSLKAVSAASACSDSALVVKPASAGELGVRNHTRLV